MTAQPPTSMKLILAMGLGGFVSGLVLVGIYQTTLPLILKNRAEALRAAVFKVIPNAQAFDTLVLEDGQLQPFQGKPGELPRGEAIYRGRDEDGRFAGYAIPSSGPGFQDTIGLIFGFDPRTRRIVGMEVLESRETPGLGDKIIFDPRFKNNFVALEISPEIVAVKEGGKTRPNEVDCISGATISSKAVVQILNKGARQWLPFLTNEAGLNPAPEEGFKSARHP